MRSLAGLEKWHSSMLQVATESLHPHWHASRAPTRRTSTLGFSRGRLRQRRHRHHQNASRLLLNRCMFLRIAHYFACGRTAF